MGIPELAVKNRTMGTKATNEQLRLARIVQDRGDPDSDLVRDSVKKVMETTSCTENVALAALRDCDDDVQSAIGYVIDGLAGDSQDWQERKSKKTKRQEKQLRDETQPEPEQVETYRNRDRGEFNRFRRGGHIDRNERRTGKENEPFTQDSRERGASSGGRGGRGSRGRDSSARGRGGRGRGRQRGGPGAPANSDNMDRIGTWSASGPSAPAEVAPNSNTWDNSMAMSKDMTWQGGASESVGAGGGGSCNVWDNTMAQGITHPPPQNEWEGDDEWSKLKKRGTLVFEASAGQVESPSPQMAFAAVQQSKSPQTPNSNNVVAALMANSPVSEGVKFSAPKTSAPPASWANNQQATDTLKNDLGIGKGGVVMPTSSNSQFTGRVEMPFDVAFSSMDIQFGDLDTSSSAGSAFELPNCMATSTGVGSDRKTAGGSSHQFYSQRTPQKQNSERPVPNGTSTPGGLLKDSAPPSTPLAYHIQPQTSSVPHSKTLSLNVSSGQQSVSKGMSNVFNTEQVPNEVTNMLSGVYVSNGSVSGMSSGHGTRTTNSISANSMSRGQPTESKATSSLNYPQTMNLMGTYPNMPYPAPMSIYSPTGIARPEDQVLQSGFVPAMMFQPTMDMSALTGAIPSLMPQHQPPTVTNNRNDSGAYSGVSGDLKASFGGRDVSGSGGSIVAPPPGFTHASVSNANRAAQLMTQAATTFPPMPMQYQYPMVQRQQYEGDMSGGGDRSNPLSNFNMGLASSQTGQSHNYHNPLMGAAQQPQQEQAKYQHITPKQNWLGNMPGGVNPYIVNNMGMGMTPFYNQMGANFGQMPHSLQAGQMTADNRGNPIASKQSNANKMAYSWNNN